MNCTFYTQKKTLNTPSFGSNFIDNCSDLCSMCVCVFNWQFRIFYRHLFHIPSSFFFLFDVDFCLFLHFYLILSRFVGSSLLLLFAESNLLNHIYLFILSIFDYMRAYNAHANTELYILCVENRAFKVHWHFSTLSFKGDQLIFTLHVGIFLYRWIFVLINGIILCVFYLSRNKMICLTASMHF